MGEITSVDVPEVFAIGDAVLDAAGRLERLSAGVGDGARLAEPAVEGSQLSLHGVVETSLTWQTTLEGFAEQVRGLGADLRKAASDYRAADGAAAGRVRETGRRAFRPGGLAGL